jgi:hypothetical protein
MPEQRREEPDAVERMRVHLVEALDEEGCAVPLAPRDRYVAERLWLRVWADRVSTKSPDAAAHAVMTLCADVERSLDAREPHYVAHIREALARIRRIVGGPP